MDLHDLGQNVQINKQRSAIDRAQRAGDSAAEQLRELELRLERLTTTCRALWSLLVEISDLGEEHLLEKVRELDLADGTADGRSTHKMKPCPSCSRPNKANRKQCMYCGAEVPLESAFDLF